MVDIRGLSRSEICDFFSSINEPAYKGEQVYQWLWEKGAKTFDEMSNLSKKNRALLKTHFLVNPITVDSTLKSSDLTLKSAIRLHDGLLVESVLIPSEKRSTACVSSQVGCSLNCNFCATARLKRMRNLEASEIFDQIIELNKQSLAHYNRKLTNIVFMGMGEPLLNYANVIKAIEKITSGLEMSPKRITLSTSGIPKMIEKLADDGVDFQLAVSLHTAVEKTRNKIMPFSVKFPLVDLKDSLHYWYQKTKRRITYEYIIWKGINDTPADADSLVKYCKYVPCKVNIIEYNSIDDSSFEQANPSAVAMYQQKLNDARIVNKVRMSRGNDIHAACGQLANKTELNKIPVTL